MADWSLPTVTSTYTNLVAEAKARDTDAALGFDPAVVTVTNPVTNMIRWTSASNKWQKYNGAIWVDLTATYNIDVAYFGGQAPSYYAALASPVFTGNPTGTTQAVDNNTTRLATTEFVLGQAGGANPLMNGSVAVGTSTRYSRQDHVHPVDTSRAPLASPTFTGTVGMPVLNITTAAQTFTPTIKGSVTAGTPTYAGREGSYYVVGNMVFISVSISLSNLGGMTGDLIVEWSGLAPNINTNTYATSFNPTIYGGVSLPTGYSLTSCIANNNSSVRFRKGNNTTTSGIIATDVTNTFYIYFNGVYLKS